MRGRAAAQEAAAVASLKRIHAAQSTYAATYPDLGYADRLRKLGSDGKWPSHEAAQLLDDSLVAAEVTPKSGYRYALDAETRLPRGDYLVQALPDGSGSIQPRPLCSGVDGMTRESVHCQLGIAPDSAKQPEQP
jgi:hypothetical protein